MRDPYDILGVKRGVSLEELKAAYRKACKTKHPDMGGSHDEMVELNTAYAFILNELKHGYQQQQREDAPGQDRAGTDKTQDQRRWERAYRDIDDELEELRRSAQAHDDALRAMRARAWKAGEHSTWVKLTWVDFSRFIRGIARSGVKGLTLLFAALIGIGSILVEANIVSALVILGSGIGLFFSLALRNDKGGLMSACLLLFGIMTIWLPPVRAALFFQPLATISVLICLGLIFKFAQQGGTVGMMTGGVLALYVIGVIVTDTQQQRPQVASKPPPLNTSSPPASAPPSLAPPIVAPPIAPPPIPPASRPQPPTQTAKPAPPPAPAPPSPPEPRQLLAAKDSMLKFVAGVPYQLKIRSGFRTRLVAVSGTIAPYRGDLRDGECVATMELSAAAATTPFVDIDRSIRACTGDAVFQVVDVK